MTTGWVQAGIAVVGIASSFMASRKAGKQANRDRASRDFFNSENLRLAKAKDAEDSRIRRINNTGRRERMETSQNFFRQLAESAVDNTIQNKQLLDATSTIEGTSGRVRRSLRSDLGGGLDSSRSKAVDLASKKALTQVRTQILATNQTRRDNLKMNLSRPVELLSPSTPTTLSANANMANQFANSANVASAEQSAFNQALGGFAQSGVKAGLQLYKDRTQPVVKTGGADTQQGLNAFLKAP